MEKQFKMITLSKEELLSEYGEVKVKFISYYKYQFSFETVLDNGEVVALTIGNRSNPEGIYRLNIESPDQEFIINNLINDISTVLIHNKDCTVYKEYKNERI
jgi:hypothetical protein